jgi:hypothetical protein
MPTDGNYRLKSYVLEVVYSALLQVCGGEDDDIAAREELHSIALSSISFPNKSSVSSIEGKPHDIEVKAALTLFHRRKRTNSDGVRCSIVSDHGLTRTVASPLELASLIQVPLEEDCRRQRISNEVRCSQAGIICIVTRDRAQHLRSFDRYPCPHCVKWCKGTSCFRRLAKSTKDY